MTNYRKLFFKSMTVKDTIKNPTKCLFLSPKVIKVTDANTVINCIPNYKVTYTKTKD